MTFINVKVVRVDSKGGRGGDRYAAKAYSAAGDGSRVWATKWICQGVASVAETRSKIEREFRGYVREVRIEWPDEDEMPNETLALAPKEKKSV